MTMLHPYSWIRRHMVSSPGWWHQPGLEVVSSPGLWHQPGLEVNLGACTLSKQDMAKVGTPIKIRRHMDQTVYG